MAEGPAGASMRIGQGCCADPGLNANGNHKTNRKHWHDTSDQINPRGNSIRRIIVTIRDRIATRIVSSDGQPHIDLPKHRTRQPRW